MPTHIAIPPELRKLIQFGSGAGIEIGATDLEATVARVRPGRVRVLGRLTIRDFATRPAAEWGAEYAKLLKSAGAPALSAAVLLPRREVIVRHVPLPGVSAKDMESAIRFQLDSLHPYGEDEAVWGWSPAARGGAVVGVAKRSTVERYAQLFAEAGIPVASFTFSAAAVHAAIRLAGATETPAEGFVALGRSATGSVEAYGESVARPVFSAEFDAPPERAAALAIAELRLPADSAPLKIEDVLGTPREPAAANGPVLVENGFSRNALPFAAALAGAFPRLAPAANLLPPERRNNGSRVAFIPTLVLAVLLAATLAGSAIWYRVSQRRYLDRVHAEIAKLQPLEQRAAALRRQSERARARVQWLDQYRSHTRQDLDLLNRLTELIERPAWTNSIDISRDAVRLRGEAPQAAALWKILDNSRLFANSKLDYNQPASGGGETFMMSGAREAGK